MVTNGFGDLLRVDRTVPRRADREFIETFACPAVVLRRLVQMAAVALLFDERRKRFERRADVA
jgi:hypothetical protein